MNEEHIKQSLAKKLKQAIDNGKDIYTDSQMKLYGAGMTKGMTLFAEAIQEMDIINQKNTTP